MANSNFFVRQGLSVNNATTIAGANGQISVGSNVTINTSTVFIGNSTVNAIANSSTLAIGTSTVNSTVIAVGSVTHNSTVIAVGSNVVVNTSGILIGNSTINAVFSANSIILSGRGIDSGSVPAGSIIQVVQFSNSTQISTSSSSYVNTNITGYITPKYTTSKILVTVDASVLHSTDNVSLVGVVIARGANNIYGGNTFYIGIGTPLALDLPIILNYLDSPANTSNTQYTLKVALTSYVGTYGGIVYVPGHPSRNCSITLTELAQ